MMRVPSYETVSHERLTAASLAHILHERFYCNHRHAAAAISIARCSPFDNSQGREPAEW